MRGRTAAAAFLLGLSILCHHSTSTYARTTSSEAPDDWRNEWETPQLIDIFDVDDQWQGKGSDEQDSMVPNFLDGYGTRHYNHYEHSDPPVTLQGLKDQVRELKNRLDAWVKNHKNAKQELLEDAQKISHLEVQIEHLTQVNENLASDLKRAIGRQVACEAEVKLNRKDIAFIKNLLLKSGSTDSTHTTPSNKNVDTPLDDVIDERSLDNGVVNETPVDFGNEIRLGNFGDRFVVDVEENFKNEIGRGKIDDLSVTVDRLVQKEEDYQKQAELMEEEVTNLKTQVDTLQKSVNSDVQTLNEDVQILVDWLYDNTEEISNLTSRADQLRNTMSTLDKRTHSKEMDNDVLTSLDGRVHGAEMAVTTIDDQISDIAQHVHHLQRRVDEMSIGTHKADIGVVSQVTDIPRLPEDLQLFPPSLVLDKTDFLATDVFRGRKYYLSKHAGQAESISDAIKQCQDLDDSGMGHLAEVDGDEEGEFIRRFLDTVLAADFDYPLGYLDGFKAAYISGSDKGQRGTWRHQRTSERMTYIDWNPGQPNSTPNENCLLMYLPDGWKMHDYYCILPHWARFVCELPA